MVIKKTGNTLRAMARSDHLRASSGLGADTNESKKISTRLSQIGLRTFEVRLATRFLILVAFTQSYFRLDKARAISIIA